MTQYSKEEIKKLRRLRHCLYDLKEICFYMQPFDMSQSEIDLYNHGLKTLDALNHVLNDLKE